MNKLKLLSFLGLFSMALNLNAQLIAPIRISNDAETFDSPKTVIHGDMDNDGDIDLVTSSTFNGNVVWYENLDGNGAMDDPKIIFSLGAFGPDFISLIDIDGDGVMDVLGIDENEVFWIKNTIEETATFSDFVYLPVSGFSFGYEAKMADINGDDILDMILTGSSLSTYWLEGIDGNGNFHPSEVLIDDGRYHIELADFDNDGDLDIVSPTYDNGDFSLGWFENLDGNANYGSIQIIDPLIELPEDLQLADFDTDGDTDILLGVWTSISNSFHYYWYENNLNNNGTWIQKVVSDTAGIAPPTIFDIDTDGDLDFVTTRGGLRIYENVDGLGNFVSGDALTIYGGTSLTHADINNDNIEDIIAVYRTSTQFQELGLLYFGRADLTFENPIDYIGDADQSTSYRGFMEGKDLNGDGIVELIASHEYVNRFDWLSFDNTHLKFTNPRIIDDVQAADIDFADFDGDGDEDIVVATSETGNVQVLWYEKLNGENNYGPANVLFTEHQSNKQVHAIDFDSDGDMDIVLNKTGGSNSGIHWFENLNGQGDFSEFQIIYNASNFDFIQMEDVDLDGDMDFFGYDNGPEGFYWFENNNAVFSDPILLLAIENVEEYLLEDLDGNGWKDLIYSNSDNVISLQKNNGSVGDYSDAINFSGINPLSFGIQLFLRDFDLDGDQDLLIREKSSANGSFLHLFEHVGSQDVFLNGINIYELPDNIRIAIDDFDGDQDMDIAVHSHTNRTMYFIENFLDKSNILGKTYLDANENANFDAGELLVFPQSVFIDPNALASFPSGSGYFNFAVENGNYDVTSNVNADFEFTTPPTLQVEVLEDSISEICFGIFPNLENVGTYTTITSAPTRCGFEVPFWVDYQNTGTVAGNVVISFEMDSLASLISSVPLPDSINGQTIYWNDTNLPPTHSGQIDLILQMPGVDQLGEFLSFSSLSTITSLDGIHYGFDGIAYRPQVNCAYDPNDKLVEPSLPEEENYTLFGDTLDYTVRFQNTGTDTAFTVIIEDYLDRDLDYSTLKVLGASHPYEVTLDETTGRLLFVFDNILLPDSTTNEVKSHGFFKYRIQHLNGLPELTYIQNYASIFFDFNPPIITNTVENILVSGFPVLVDIQHPSCIGTNDGSLTMLYELTLFDSILWSTGDTDLSISNLSNGEYNLTIFFSNGTQFDTTYLITEPSAINTLDPVVEVVNCFGIDDGSIEITVNGGTPDYLYEWNNSVITANQYDLAPGTYTLTITDSKNCKDTLEVILEAPNEIFVTIDMTPELDQTMNGTISVQASGGQAPFSYAWDFDPNETGNMLSGLSFGDYTVTITDANGCSQIETITVEQITPTDDFNKQFHFEVRPNPNDGVFNVNFNTPNQEVWQVNITNSLGQLVRVVKSTVQVNTEEQLSFVLEPGIYQVSFLIEGKIVQSEIVIAM